MHSCYSETTNVVLPTQRVFAADDDCRFTQGTGNGVNLGYKMVFET